MTQIVGACISQYHDDENKFELLLSYADGREIGHSMSRAAANAIYAEFARELDDCGPVAVIVEAATPAAQMLYGRDINFLKALRDIPVGTKLFVEPPAPTHVVMSAARSFMDLFNADGEGLSTDDIDPMELANRYEALWDCLSEQSSPPPTHIVVPPALAASEGSAGA